MINCLRRSLFVLVSFWFAGAQQPAAFPKVSAQDWKRLHKHPKTPEDFRMCAEWCRQEAERFRQQEVAYETEMKALHARSANHEGPKYPPIQDELREEIEYYRGRILYWTHLAAAYQRKVAAR